MSVYFSLIFTEQEIRGMSSMDAEDNIKEEVDEEVDDENGSSEEEESGIMQMINKLETIVEHVLPRYPSPIPRFL